MGPVAALSALTQWELLLGASFTHSFSQGPMHTEHLWEQEGCLGSFLITIKQEKATRSYKHLLAKLEMPCTGSSHTGV